MCLSVCNGTLDISNLPSCCVRISVSEEGLQITFRREKKKLPHQSCFYEEEVKKLFRGITSQKCRLVCIFLGRAAVCQLMMPSAGWSTNTNRESTTFATTWAWHTDTQPQPQRSPQSCSLTLWCCNLQKNKKKTNECCTEPFLGKPAATIGESWRY